VQQQYEVLLWVGDNLRDFDEAFRFQDPPAGSNIAPSALEERRRQVDANNSRWGNDWIILPNPAYGEWNKPLNRGEQDIEWLLPPATGG
jgi:predicted secreted acid phosphatase